MEVTDPNGRPTDEQFKEFKVVKPLQDEYNTHTYIPVLDDYIAIDKVQVQVKRIRRDKASSPDMVCPAVLKALPM